MAPSFKPTYHSDPIFAEMYDFVTPYRDRGDVEFFVEEAARAGGPVLEIGAGTGRVLIPTARAGVNITGLDVSPAMLEVCRKHLAQESAEVQAHVQLVEGDMRGFELAQTFRLVTLPFRPFQHLIDVDDQLACLHCIFHHLEPGGRVILDLFNPWLEKLADDKVGIEQAGEESFNMPGGRRVERRHRIVARDHDRQVQDVELIYYINYPDGRQERHVHAFPMRYFFRFEAEHLLVRAGFTVDAVYAGYDRAPFGSRSPSELILMGSKPPA